MHKVFNTFKRYIYLILFASTAIISNDVLALEPSFYAERSALADGHWAKIEVKEDGMQFISNTMLRNLGFTDPSKVNVYGFGGRMLSERLNGDMPDDLPPVPSIQTSRGILFFGRGFTDWTINGGTSDYMHIANPYSDHSYYFLSDKEEGRFEPSEMQMIQGANGSPITIFTERTVHEQDILAPSNTGRLLLGEDFRAQNNRSFKFDLPGNTGDAVVTISFGAKCSGNGSALIITANGETLPSEKTDQIAAAASERFIVKTTTVKNVENPGNTLNLGIQFTGSGAISTAALDYIEVEYPRSIALDNGELYFYINPDYRSPVTVKGCSSETIIWDVTNPLDIKKVEYTFSGSDATFVADAGYGEYIAFNPESITRTVTSAGKVNNQDIHSMDAPGLLIITPSVFRQAAERLAELHAKTDGLSVLILSPEEIYNEFSSGNPDVTAFRKLLKMWYDRAGGQEGNYAGYCLLMSRPTYDNKMVTSIVKNAGYPRLPIWQSPTGDTESSSYSTDDYIGMLEDNDKDLNLGNAKIHVAVGRMPLKSAYDADVALNKLENYLLNPNLGSWRNNVMIIADDQDNGVHLNQAEACYEAMREGGNGANFIYEKLYLDSYPLVYSSTGATYPDAKQRMFDKINEGVNYIDYIGHANPSSWGHEGLLTWTDITSFSNTNLPFIYAATCEFLRWDDDAVSGAEEMWLNPTAGVIGMICPSRSVLISSNGVLNKATSAFVFQRDKDGLPLRVGDIMIKGKNSGQTDSNKLRYGLMGDPSMRLSSPTLNVVVDKIDTVDINESDELPVIPAASIMKVEGHITDYNGMAVNDFNGLVELQLYDAENVITTYGNGADGVQSVYNDRKTRLYSGKVNVVEGKWNATIMMPSEIENNYSPALLSLYASDKRGREANGACEQFYIYGFDDRLKNDNVGPDIIEFYLNGPNFTDGASVSPSPLIKARFRDESGINLSEAGFGHSIMIALDNKKYFDDVVRYYESDPEDPCAGAVTYQLENIPAGDHTLSLTVWDNAANSTTETIHFTVSAAWMPEIETLTTDVNPATTSVNFIIATDGIAGATKCKVEVFDLLGRKVWTSNNADMTSGNTLMLGWNLQDQSGARVPRGIYLYKATVTTGNGATVTRSKKLAVTS